MGTAWKHLKPRYTRDWAVQQKSKVLCILTPSGSYNVIRRFCVCFLGIWKENMKLVYIWPFIYGPCFTQHERFCRHTFFMIFYDFFGRRTKLVICIFPLWGRVDSVAKRREHFYEKPIIDTIFWWLFFFFILRCL